MIIVTEANGFLSNRLYALSPFLAFCRKNSVRLWILSFGDYSAYYPNLNSCRFIRFVNVNGRYLFKLRQFQLFLSAHFNGRILFFYFNDQASKRTASLKQLKHQFCFLDPWIHPKPPISTTDLVWLRVFFRPSDATIDKISHWLSSRFGDSPAPLLAVHARRGDYQNFQSGRFFYSEDQYVSFILQSIAAISILSGLTPNVVVCSNDPQFLNASPWILSPFPEAHEDHYLMAQAEYIIGPPSTFSHWAAFIGSSKICFLEKGDQIIAPQSFADPPVFDHPSLLLK